MGSSLRDLNMTFSQWIAAKFEISQGDEFQGLVTLDCPLDRLWWRYWSRMHTVAKTRFGVGIGELAVDLGPAVNRLDGPCFHSAREALDSAKSKERLLELRWAGRDDLTMAISRNLALFNSFVGAWSRVQWETVSLLAESDSQVAVAEARGVTKQSVQDVVHGKSTRGLECIESLRGAWGLAQMAAGASG